MRFAMINIIIIMMFFLVITVGGILLQVFLSRKESKWPGLILPILSFGISLMALFGVMLFSAHKGTLTVTENGTVIEQTVTQGDNMSAIIVSAISVFIFYNIPTLILLAVYAACRGKRSKQRALEKMSVQDLE